MNVTITMCVCVCVSATFVLYCLLELQQCVDGRQRAHIRYQYVMI